MKKILFIITLLSLLAFSSSCTKTKKEVDWVTTILFYELVGKSKSVGNRCNLPAPEGSASTSYACKDYTSGFTTDTINADCAPGGTFPTALGLTADSLTPGTNMNCDTTGSTGSCTVDDTANGTKYTVTFYSAYDSTKMAAYCTTVGGALTTK